MAAVASDGNQNKRCVVLNNLIPLMVFDSGRQPENFACHYTKGMKKHQAL
jgi:hypothetical protein